MSWPSYRRMYQLCQYLVYCTNNAWIMDWSNVFRIIWNGFIQIGVIWINVNWVIIILFQFRAKSAWFQLTKCSRPKFSILKLSLRSEFLKTVLYIRFSTRFKVSFFIGPCHEETLLTESNMSQLLILVLVTCGRGISMAVYGFIAIFHPCSAWNQHSFSYHFFSSQSGSPDHRVLIYKWN